MTLILGKFEHRLKEDRQAILRGDFEHVAGRVQLKEKTLQGLIDAQLPTVDVAPIQIALHHNHTLLNAALKGVRDAIGTLHEIRTLHENFASYSARGTRKLTLVNAHNRLDRQG